MATVSKALLEQGFRSPMLATALNFLPPGKWVAEQKYDGHRLIVSVTTNAQEEPLVRSGKERERKMVRAWSRAGKERGLPVHLVQALSLLPPGIYDGELIVPQGYSSSVTELTNQMKLQYVLFDMLTVGDKDATSDMWMVRRTRLEEAYRVYSPGQNGSPGFGGKQHVLLAETVPVRTWEEVQALADEVWLQKGEGLIVKDTAAPYRCGKRTKTFIKVKECQPAVLQIIGFAPSEGEVSGYGDFGTAVLEDRDGLIVPVKVLDDATRARLNKADTGARKWQDVRTVGNIKVHMHTDHPWVGRNLHIEFQSRTPDGSYRHPRWDRLDGE